MIMMSIKNLYYNIVISNADKYFKKIVGTDKFVVLNTLLGTYFHYNSRGAI